MKFLLLLTAALVCSAAAIGVALGGRPAPGAMHTVARAAGERTVAPRFSVTERHRPCTRVRTRGEGMVPREACGPDREPPAYLGQVFDVAAESAAPDSLRASALARLLWWDRKEPSLHDAIDRLSKALRLTTDTVPLLVDLSGAHLVRAERTQSSLDLMVAANYAGAALAAQPGNRAALWNQALALHAFGLQREAARAWDAYLAADSTSAWANEARARRRAIRPARAPREPAPGAPAYEVEAFAARHPQEARMLGFDRVLGEWGAAVEAGDAARAAVFLGFAETLGRALRRRPGGDASLADAVQAIRAARSSPAAVARLARAHRMYAQGQAHYERLEYPKADTAFAGVLRLRPPSHVLRQWTTLFGEIARPRDQTIGVVRALLADLDTVRYAALAGRARLTLATLLTKRGEYPEARPEDEAAERHLTRAGETELLGPVLSIRSEAQYEQGDTVQAYASMQRALQVLRPHPPSRWQHNHLLAMAKRAIQDGMPWAAMRISNQDKLVAARLGQGFFPVESLQWEAWALASAGDTAGAVQVLSSAVARLDSLSEEEQKEWARNAIRVASPGGVSAAAMDSAVDHFSNDMVWLIPAMLGRADARFAEGNVRGGTADLDSVTRIVRSLSGNEGDVRLRAAMMEQARKSFDRLVMLHVNQNRPGEALRALERGRISFGNGGRPGDAERVAAPAGHVALEYALVGDTLLVWTVRGNSVRLHRDTVNRDAFLLTVEQTNAALQSSARAARAHPGLRRLYDQLIRPVRHRLGPGTRLVIVADGEVAGVPFPALFDTVRGRYLVHDHPLRFSATLADAARGAPSRPAAVSPALLVADPAFSTVHYSMLDALGGARAEVDALGRFYPDSMRLERESATREAFVARAQRASVIHYAGHAIFDDARPERSFLVLAGAGAASRLAAEDIDTLDLRGVRLVVLSACRTLRARGGRSGGFDGLSGALLRAGAGGVVGSLWQVRDQRTRELMVAFHAAYRDSADPVLALWQAQLTMLASDDPALRSPATWAGFRYAGR